MVKEEKAYFGAGCFWGVEAAFRQIKGVLGTAVGYMGGKTAHPTYEEVCSDRTGHVETVEVRYDSERTSYQDLLKVFWENHNPTTPNRQGADVGSQYRSVIFYTSPEQEQEAQRSKADLEQSGQYDEPVVTTIEPAPPFHLGEEYHQQYLEKRGLSSCRL